MLERFRQSLAIRLAAIYTLVFALGAAALFGALFWVLAHSLEARDRVALELRAANLAQAYVEGGALALRERLSADTSPEARTLYVGLLEPGGATVFASIPSDWVDPQFERRLIPNGWGGWSTAEIHSVRIPRDAARDFAVASRALPDGRLIQVARITDSRAVLLAPLRKDFAVIGAIAMLFSLSAGTFLAWRTTQPLREVADTARRILVEHDLAARIPTPPGSGELALLVRQLNTLLDKNATHVRVLRETLDDLAHDLRTPLTRLRGTAELALQDGGNPADARGALADCVDETDRVLHLLEVLLDVSAAEAGVLTLRRERVDLANLAARAADLYREVAEQRKIKIELDLFPAELEGDPVRLGQALSNLLDNALKFTPEGGRVAIATAAEAGAVAVTVSDNGPGVPVVEREAVWRRLFRGDASRSQRGLGLGLALVRAVAEAHGGSATVGDSPGGGARFQIRLPAAIRALFLILAGFAGFQARAAERGARYQGSAWALLDSQPELQAAASITPARYPNCDEATVDERSIQVYRADGIGEAQDEIYLKLLTEKGRRDNGVVTVDFVIPYSEAEVARLEVIKPDGRVVPVDVAANSKVSIESSQIQENIYDPNSRLLQVNVPQLEIGDLLHSVTRYTILRPIIPGAYSDDFLFEGPGYVRHISAIIRAPANCPLRQIALRAELRGTVTYSNRREPDGTLVHDWEVNNVPRMYDEPSMPPYEMVLQRLLVSTLPDWRPVSRWYWNLSRTHLAATTPEMKRTVEQLTAGAASGMDRMKAIFYYVSKRIRYLGVTPEKDRPGFEPHDVKLTFDKKYGVCRDKAALLVSMLRMAGVKAYPVLINVGTRLDQRVPSPFFNHAIVAVESSPGDYLLMDPTDGHTRVLRPAYDDNQSYLVCRPEGETLKLSPVSPPSENLMRVATTGILSGSGALDATAVLSFAGANDDEYRGIFAEMKPDDRRRFFESRLQRVIPGTRLISLHLTPENILDESSPLRAEMRISANAMAGFGGGKAIVSVPWLGRAFGIVNLILDGTGLDRRKYPLETEVACGVEENITLRLADSFTGVLSLPSSLPVDDGCVGYHRSYRFGGHTLDCSKELELKVVEFSPEQYVGLKRMLNQIDYDERKAPVMATAAGAGEMPAALAGQSREPAVDSDAEVLQDRQELVVTGAHEAVLKVSYAKKILTYAGKVREAEVKIPFNPSTETAELLHAAVISRTGERQEISSDELNLMDAAWNASAKRYTGGKILVASLPGVDIGSIIEVEFQITIHGKQTIAGFESFQLADRLDQKSFRITAPAGLKVLARVTANSGGLAEETSAANGVATSTWSARRVAPLAEEPDLPPDWSYRPGVAYFVGDPAAYLKDLNSAMVERANRSAKARDLALRLAAKAKTRLGAVEAIGDYVAEFIRPTDPPLTDLPLSELSDADTTLAEGYANAADRAILFHAMLAAAGFHPEFVLASDLPDIPGLAKVASSFPLPGAFETPLVRVSVDGRTYTLNDTDQYARLGSTPHDGEMAIALPDGSRTTVRAAEGCATKVTTSYRLSLADDGNANIAIERRYFGMAYAEKKRFFSELPPEETNRYYQETVSKLAQGARAVGGLVTRFDSYPGVERFAVEVARYAIADGRFFYFKSPFEPRLIKTETDRRILPLFVPQDSSEDIRVQIALPPGFRRIAISPKAGDYREPDGAGAARILALRGGGSYTVSYRLERRPAIIPPPDYPAALDLESALENKAARVFLLELGPGLPPP